MNKLVTLVIVGVSVCFIGLLLGVKALVEDHKSISNPNFASGQHGQLLEDTRYTKLKNLASNWLVGPFYKEAWIKQLVRRKQWTEVVEEASTALSSIVNRREYRIWHYKAVGQCAQFKLQSCRLSLYEAEILAPRYYLPKLNKLKSIFNFKHKSYLESRRQQLCQL